MSDASHANSLQDHLTQLTERIESFKSIFDEVVVVLLQAQSRQERVNKMIAATMRVGVGVRVRTLGSLAEALFLFVVLHAARLVHAGSTASEAQVEVALLVPLLLVALPAQLRVLSESLAFVYFSVALDAIFLIFIDFVSICKKKIKISAQTQQHLLKKDAYCVRRNHMRVEGAEDGMGLVR
jgi:hypothetical protein